MPAAPTLKSVALSSRSVADLVAFGRAAIETAGTFERVKDIRNQAEALRVFQRAQGAAQEAIDASVEIKLRAERRMGEELRKAEKHEGGRPTVAKTGRVERPVSPPTIADLGITKDEAARYQKLAATPEPILTATIAAHREQRVPLTTASVQRVTRIAAEQNWSPADIQANPLPTASEARRLAKERGVSVIARDGKLHDGRSVAEEKADHEATQRAGCILHPLEEIVGIIEAGMTPADYLAALDVPRFPGLMDDDLDEAWSKAWPWFREFNEIWSAHRAAG